MSEDTIKLADGTVLTLRNWVANADTPEWSWVYLKAEVAAHQQRREQLEQAEARLDGETDWHAIAKAAEARAEQAEKGWDACSKSLKAAATEHEQVLAQVAVLAEALEKYGLHLYSHCHTQCHCGLDEAKATLPDRARALLDVVAAAKHTASELGLNGSIATLDEALERWEGSGG